MQFSTILSFLPLAIASPLLVPRDTCTPVTSSPYNTSPWEIPQITTHVHSPIPGTTDSSYVHFTFFDVNTCLNTTCEVDYNNTLALNTDFPCDNTAVSFSFQEFVWNFNMTITYKFPGNIDGVPGQFTEIASSFYNLTGGECGGSGSCWSWTEEPVYVKPQRVEVIGRKKEE